MTHFEHGNAKEKHTILKQRVRDALKSIKDSKTEFCTMSRARYLKGIADRAQSSLRDFESRNPEVII